VRKESYAFLEELLSVPSPSGFEGPAQALFRRYIEPFCDSIRSDVHGNVIGVLNETGRPRVMLAGHMDQIGFMVQYINEEGFIYFEAIGGVDRALLPGQRVRIHTKKGPVPGVVGKKPIHLMEKEEREKLPKMKEIWIDIGARSRAEAAKIVSIGDPITFTLSLERLRGDLVVASGFDDKVGSFVVAETFRLLSKRRQAAAIFGVSTVQEELGLRGARTSAFGIEPDVGIAVDVGFATDYPEVDRRLMGEVKVGRGVIVYKGANINPLLGQRIIDLAQKNRIPIQIRGAPKPTGTDANVMQVTRAGVATALIGIPNRYMHTPVEVVSLSDLESASRLLALLIQSLSGKDSFIPE